MADHLENGNNPGDDAPTRRRFLKQLGKGAVVGGAATPLLAAGCGESAAAEEPKRIKMRTLGKTGLKVSEIGFGGHSWSYKRVPDGADGYRLVNVDEAVEMIATGFDMGANFFDSCTPLDESRVPGEALKRLKRRDDAIISIRVSHMMNGNENDKQEIIKWTEDRLKLWHTDCVDLCLLCNTENDTKLSGYWDMSYAIEALDKLKQQGKIRYTGFGCHFTPDYFREAFEKFGDYFDICSMPYNIRHSAAKGLLPDAKKKNMGTITIKPFARGSLLKKKDLTGADAGLPRDLIAYVLEDENVDICTCGVHTLDQVKENFSASWTPISAEGRKRLEAMTGIAVAGGEHAWLEEGWV